MDYNLINLNFVLAIKQTRWIWTTNFKPLRLKSINQDTIQNNIYRKLYDLIICLAKSFIHNLAVQSTDFPQKIAYKNLFLGTLNYKRKEFFFSNQPIGI